MDLSSSERSEQSIDGNPYFTVIIDEGVYLILYGGNHWAIGAATMTEGLDFYLKYNMKPVRDMGTLSQWLKDEEIERFTSTSNRLLFINKDRMEFVVLTTDT